MPKYRIEVEEYPAYGYMIIAPDEHGEDICWRDEDGFYTEEEARAAAQRVLDEADDAE